MSLIDIDPDELLPGLLPGAFRGVVFHVPDIRHEAGRRVAQTLFPGLDEAAVEDLGLHRGMIDVVGVIIGDDYVVRAEALRVACETAGPGMLLHPWLGERLVTVGEVASISFSARELRVARIRVGFFPYDAPSLLSSTLSTLLGAIAAVAAPAINLATVVVGATALPVALWSAARGMADRIGTTTAAAAAASRGADALVPALTAPLADLAAADDQPPGAAGAAALGAAVTALPEPIATLALGAAVSAIAPRSSSAAVAQTFGVRDGATLLLALADAVGALAALTVQEQAMRLAALAAIVAQAARVVADIPHESRQEAMAWRAQMMAALDRLDGLASDLGSETPDAIARLLATSGALRAAVAADINEAIGRLPTVLVVTPPAVVSAWLLAQHFAGDDPSGVVAMFDDIVRRNKLRHPALVSGAVEVLY